MHSPRAPQGGDQRFLIVTADDLGLTEEINRGIIAAHTKGILRSASLLMNGVATDHALDLIRRHPGLEIGAHLGIVEGRALRGVTNTLTDPLRYLGGELCLHRGWPAFVAQYVRGRIDLGELEAELDLQLSLMQAAIGRIAFANGTQHMHLLPGVVPVVLRLLRKYQIPYLRLPRRSLGVPGYRRRRAVNLALSLLGRRASRQARRQGISSAQYFAGFDICGHLSTAALCQLLTAMPAGTMELMAHPGEDSPYLREHLPWGYQDFHWATELAALTSSEARDCVRSCGIQLIQFKDLPTLTSPHEKSSP